MNKKILLFSTAVIMYFTACHRTEAPAPAREFGFLNLNVALQIEELPTGRVEAVSPDDFQVTIYNVDDGIIAEQWDTYLEVPEQVQLPTGTYYVTATNLAEPEDAAFEQPWYFGESDVFTIDKEELKTVDVECSLANCKISFSYSQNVLDNFTNWDATATIDDGNGTGAFLEWIQNDPAEGYFLTDLPIDIEVYLEYVKAFDPDELITRTFTHTISDPAPATHYLVNIDASLEDGKIMINITVDDDFTTEEINLGDEVSFRSCKEILDAGESTGDGVYQIDPDGSGGNDPYDCFCDMTTNGGGWTRVWGNVMGSTSHPVENILWDEALNRIPQETDNAYTGLTIWNDIIGEGSEGEFLHTWETASEFKSFKATIQKFTSEDNFTIKMSNYVELTQGSGGHDLLDRHNNLPFTTIDFDNDGNSGNCASYVNGAPFWYHNCWTDSFWGEGFSNPERSGTYWLTGYTEAFIGTGFYYLR